MDYSRLFGDFATQNKAPESRRWVPGLAAAPKSRVSVPASFQGRFLIDSAPFWDRFGDDFEGFSAMCSVVFCNIIDICLFNCAVAELQLAALKI